MSNGDLETALLRIRDNERLRLAYDHLMLIAVQWWHECAQDISLIDWLEVSWDEYGKWLKDSDYVMEFLPHD